MDVETCVRFIERLGLEGAPREIVRETAHVGRSKVANALLHRASGGELLCVIVARLEDLAPGSVLQVLSLVTRLEQLQVPVCSVEEDQWFGPRSGQRPGVIRAFEWAVAKQCSFASERVRLTIDRRKGEAARAGLPFHWGRSAQSLAVRRPDLRARVEELRGSGASWKMIAKQLGITVSAARRLHEISERGHESPPL